MPPRPSWLLPVAVLSAIVGLAGLAFDAGIVFLSLAAFVPGATAGDIAGALGLWLLPPAGIACLIWLGLSVRRRDPRRALTAIGLTLLSAAAGALIFISMLPRVGVLTH